MGIRIGTAVSGHLRVIGGENGEGEAAVLVRIPPNLRCVSPTFEAARRTAEELHLIPKWRALLGPRSL